MFSKFTVLVFALLAVMVAASDTHVVTLSLGGNANSAGTATAVCTNVSNAGFAYGFDKCTIVGNRPRDRKCSISCSTGSTVQITCVSNNNSRRIDTFRFVGSRDTCSGNSCSASRTVTDDLTFECDFTD